MGLFSHPTIGKKQLNVTAIPKVFCNHKVEIHITSHTYNMQTWLIFSMHGRHLNGLCHMKLCVNRRQEVNVGKQHNSRI